MSRPKDVDRQPVLSDTGRRDFLKLGVASIAAVVSSPVLALPATQHERLLSFQNTHTGESATALYWADGEYLDSGREEINALLRDHRTDDIYPIDTSLLDLLFVLQSKTGSRETFEVISGYRSPATNKALRRNSSGVARRSYHMQGKAIDVRLPGVELKQLHRAAVAIAAGGVGYYPGSGFIHVDVGPRRTW